MLILRGEISKQRERQRSLKLEQDLNSILKEWKWGTQTFTTAQEFLTKMKPWITNKIKEGKELEEFLKKKKVKSLAEIK